MTVETFNGYVIALAWLCPLLALAMRYAHAYIVVWANQCEARDLYRAVVASTFLAIPSPTLTLTSLLLYSRVSDLVDPSRGFYWWWYMYGCFILVSALLNVAMIVTAVTDAVKWMKLYLPARSKRTPSVLRTQARSDVAKPPSD